MYHAAYKVEFQPFKRLYSQLTFFNFLYSMWVQPWIVETQLCKLRGTFRHVRIIWLLWIKPTIWLILSLTQNIVRACSVFYPNEGYRSVTPLAAARVNRTIFHNHSVHWYYITLIKGRYYSKHDMNKDMVNRTRVESGGYIKRDNIT